MNDKQSNEWTDKLSRQKDEWIDRCMRLRTCIGRAYQRFFLASKSSAGATQSAAVVAATSSGFCFDNTAHNRTDRQMKGGKERQAGYRHTKQVWQDRLGTDIWKGKPSENKSKKRYANYQSYLVGRSLCRSPCVQKKKKTHLNQIMKNRNAFPHDYV